MSVNRSVMTEFDEMRNQWVRLVLIARTTIITYQADVVNTLLS